MKHKDSDAYEQHDDDEPRCRAKPFNPDRVKVGSKQWRKRKIKERRMIRKARGE